MRNSGGSTTDTERPWHHRRVSGPRTHDEYLAGIPEPQRPALEAIRATVRAVAPGAVETIGYGIPTFRIGTRNLVHYAGFAGHDSFFPGSAALLDSLGDEVARWRAGRGTLRFPHGEPIPLEVVARIVALRLEEEAARAATRSPRAGRRAPRS